VSRTVVHLLRHGEVHNPQGVLYGRLPDYHLSDLGRVMADRAAEALSGRDVALVWSSPMERAQETAVPVAAAHDLPIGLDDRLLEATNVFEGQRVSVGDGVLRQPRTWVHLRNPIKPSWGEPYREVAARMASVIENARVLVEGHEAVLVSHQLPIWISRLSLEGRRLAHNPAKRQCNLASLTSLVYDGHRLVAVLYTEPSADLMGQSTKGVGA
jgi:broad specificity phosphatase PhoE